MKKERYLITAALPYTNGPVHIGHLAGVYIPADIYARYQRAKGRDAIYICGSDEHGVPITIRAKKEGKSPKEIVDHYHRLIKKSFEDFGISFDNYSRTSLPLHHRTAADFFKKLYDKGELIEKETEQLYDEQAGQFLADRFVKGTCPKCGYEEAYGDQCEKCGTSLSPTELINPVSTLTGTRPVLKKTKHWYLPLDKYEDKLRKWILEEHKDDWKPNVLGQVKSWLDEGLRPRAVTRDLDWGVPVPLEGAEGKVLYVWFDAPIGYISSTKEWAQKTGKDWKPYWKDDSTKLVHFIGKDNIVFHTIIFPAMLMAHGDYILPDNVPANEFLNLEGDKISTSRNWAVWLHEYLEDFPGKQDVLRYVLTAIAPETKDNDFTWKDFQTRNNTELVGNLGNFFNRVMVLTNKYYDGRIPEPGTLTDRDREVLEEIRAYPGRIGELIEKFRFRDALASYMKLAQLGNKYLAEEEPWKKIKTDPDRVRAVMFTANQIAAALAALGEVFLPFTAEKMKKMLRLDEQIKWDRVAEAEPLIPAGRQIGKPELLFEKIDDEAIRRQIDKLHRAKKAQSGSDTAPLKEQTDIETFGKLDIRTATIREAERIPKAKKLLKLTLDTGAGPKTVVAGIAEHYKPEDLPGQKVVYLANLKPVKLRGVLSEGMLLMTENAEGKPVFISPDEPVPDGKQVK
ncbi:MAG: methionine--tRNA ligase [Chlorobi bacterium]|nr:methionine--tRNA ligase [Chlorobiota bacterium]